MGEYGFVMPVWRELTASSVDGERMGTIGRKSEIGQGALCLVKCHYMVISQLDRIFNAKHWHWTHSTFPSSS